MIAPLTCEECGEKIDESAAPFLLAADVLDALDMPVLCEGCAEDALDAVRSGCADARELGFPWADEHGE